MEYRNRLTILMNRSLSSLRNPFARLLYVASTRDPYTGYYFHDGWASVATVEEVVRTVKKTHLSIFESVLDLPLEEVCGQLHEHFKSLEGSDREIAKKWLEGEPFRDAIPEGSSTLQREFFLSQMRAALWLLVASSSLGVLPERYALRLQQPAPQFPHRQEI